MQPQHMPSVTAASTPTERISRSYNNDSGVRRPISDESWVEISSTASSSSASISNTGRLRPMSPVHDNSPRHRRRRLLRNAVSGPIPSRSSPPLTIDHPHYASSARLHRPTTSSISENSSQEEYEESESDSDRIITSSNENITAFRPINPSIRLQSSGATSSSPDTKSLKSEEEEDESATALGIGTNHSRHYTPPANAFTHPPSHLSARRASHSTQTTQARFAAMEQRRYSSTSTARPYRSSRSPSAQVDNHAARRGTHSPYNTFAPHHRVDHDAVLRASLSTLLSCAAAVRGQPKSDQPSQSQPMQNRHTNTNTAVQPSSLRLVPDSEIHAQASAPVATSSRRQRSTSRTKDSKRKASPSSKERSTTKTKKPRAASPDRENQEGTLIMNPRLMGWVMSASVVVIFSALSFSAGYVIGREAGRLEALRAAGVGEASGVGELGERVLRRGGRGLRRLRGSLVRVG